MLIVLYLLIVYLYSLAGNVHLCGCTSKATHGGSVWDVFGHRLSKMLHLPSYKATEVQRAESVGQLSGIEELKS